MARLITFARQKRNIRMEKRIRIVWILSLVSALLVIGVQAYWLYNQYCYVIDTYAGEMAARVLQAGEDEFQLRRGSQNSLRSYIIQRETVYRDEPGTASSKQIVFHFGAVDSTHRESVDSLRIQALRMKAKPLPGDTVADEAQMLRLTIGADVTDDMLHAGLDRAIANYSIPFDVAPFDSILARALPGVAYVITPPTEADTAWQASHWTLDGRLHRPAIRVAYAYSPLEHRGIIVDVALPPQPIFGRMAAQLALAFGLVLLLTGCLVFQIKTILKQQKLSELRENFVHTMIHELKRPVQTLKTFVAFLGDRQMRSDGEATARVVQDAMFELDNLSAYLTKLKDLVRADNETTTLHPVRFDLKALTEKVIRLTPVPAGKDVQLGAAFDEMESTEIEADPVHIANILFNLIENALKYSGERVRIRITAGRKGRELRLTVTEDGIGIPLAEQQKVFVRFYRATNIPDRTIPGIGLGLSYVKLITEAHRGSVALASRHGEGTSVTISLPQ